MYLMTEEGLEEIRQQLISKLKPNGYDYQGDDFIGSKEQDHYLEAFAEDLGDAMTEYMFMGNDSPEGAQVEIGQHLTKSGHVEFISVTKKGYRHEVELYIDDGALNVDAPDGSYLVVAEGFEFVSDSEVTVLDGKADSDEMMKAARELLLKSGYWGMFLEATVFSDGRLTIYIGS